MTARFYTGPAFVETLAAKTRTAVLMLQTGDAIGASSSRFQDITGVPDDVRAELYDTGLAFVTFDTAAEANAAFDTLVANWPQQGQTTLPLTAVLGLPDRRTREFQQIPGHERTFKIAA
ncbi:hypothetical protein [Sphingosinicella sp. BN140058]|uniref:hypothetical protein n=1 Tax=Sphingosinicella sp. BN140058 TaxID=1892855 RepID=UPI00101364D4|nr:hypothetical protein [Sphingosinicella sp. BN140058]QAY80224.1 hypothetical protein ETR14_26640 [Sphingosinicella sp. BN140058]